MNDHHHYRKITAFGEETGPFMPLDTMKPIAASIDKNTDAIESLKEVALGNSDSIKYLFKVGGVMEEQMNMLMTLAKSKSAIDELVVDSLSSIRERIKKLETRVDILEESIQKKEQTD